MQGLFVHDHRFPRKNKNYYYSYGFDEEFFKRYLSIFDKLSVIGRHEDLESLENDKINKNIKFTTFKNLKQLINKNNRLKIDKKIKKSNYIVIRLPSILGLYAVWKAKKLQKPYLIEVVGCAWDAISNKGITKILPAIIITYLTKKAVYSANYVVYVTEKFLEDRYPTKGEYIACSNVTLEAVKDEDLSKRYKRIGDFNLDKKIIIGTCATIDVIYKGQEDVIEAMANLVNKGYDIEYQLVGGGDSSYLKSVAEKFNVLNRIKFIGAIEHKKVFEWLENIDIYVHPSKQEGLSRAIIEAMSKGCPVFGADAGGIHELIDEEFIFDKGNINQICNIFEKFDKKTMKNQASKNHKKSKDYLKKVLYKRREDFFEEFIQNSKKENPKESF